MASLLKYWLVFFACGAQLSPLVEVRIVPLFPTATKT